MYVYLYEYQNKLYNNRLTDRLRSESFFRMYLHIDEVQSIPTVQQSGYLLSPFLVLLVPIIISQCGKMLFSFLFFNDFT